MALIVYEGFDHYLTVQDLQARVGALQWNEIVGGTTSFVPGRGGYGYAVEMVSGLSGFIFGGSFNQNFVSGIPSIAAIVTDISGSGSYLDFQVMDYSSNQPQLTFRCFLNSGTVLVYLGDVTGDGSTDTLINQSPPNAFNPFIWNKFECKAVIGSSGSYDFHIGGSSVVSNGGVPTNTQASANTWFNGLRMRGGFPSFDGGPTVLFDDFNMNDLTTGSGTYPVNNFIGDCATRSLFTTANHSVQWTPLANANWQEVGETQFDRDTSYNYATTVGNTDLFTFGSLPTTVAVVFGVQLTGGYRKQDASDQTIVQVFDSGGTTSYGSAKSMSLDWAFYTDLLVLDPNTSATWTPTSVNALIAGYKLNS